MQDRCSLEAVREVVSARGDYGYLRIGAARGMPLEPFLLDERCRRVAALPPQGATMGERAPAHPKLAYPEPQGSGEISDVQLCLLDLHCTNDMALREARRCRAAMNGSGVIVIRDWTLAWSGIRRFLKELEHFQAYPLASDLFVVEMEVPALLGEATIAELVPRSWWRHANRLNAVRSLIAFGALLHAPERILGRLALILGTPPRAAPAPAVDRPTERLFEVHTFVTDEQQYSRMRESFVRGGFPQDAFVRHSDIDESPYSAVTAIAQDARSRYAVLCHQDVRADLSAGAQELAAALARLDELDPAWWVAGNAGVMPSGRLVRHLEDPLGGPTDEPLPLLVAALDENFLVLNVRNRPRCSAGLAGFHLYGTDVCLHALANGGAAYVIGFPVTHLSPGNPSRFAEAREEFCRAWSAKATFRYVLTPQETVYLGRWKPLQRIFGCSRALRAVDSCRREYHGLPLRAVDRIATAPWRAMAWQARRIDSRARGTTEPPAGSPAAPPAPAR